MVDLLNELELGSKMGTLQDTSTLPESSRTGKRRLRTDSLGSI